MTPGRNLAVSVFPQGSHGYAIAHRITRSAPMWTHMGVDGSDARALLDASRSLIAAAERDPVGADPSPFSEIARQLLPRLNERDRLLVISPEVCPLDAAHNETGHWGDRAVFSHLHASSARSSDALESIIYPVERPLDTYLLVC